MARVLGDTMMTESTLSDPTRLNAFLERIMLIFQESQKLLENVGEDMAEHVLSHGLDTATAIQVNLPRAEFDAMCALISQARGSDGHLGEMIGLIAPFVTLARNFIAAGVAIETALHKLLYTLSIVCSFLLQRGFCLPAVFVGHLNQSARSFRGHT